MYEHMVIEGWVDEEALAKFLAGAGKHATEKLKEVAEKLERRAHTREHVLLQGSPVSLATMEEAARRLRIIAGQR